MTSECLLCKVIQDHSSVSILAMNLTSLPRSSVDIDALADPPMYAQCAYDFPSAVVRRLRDRPIGFVRLWLVRAFPRSRLGSPPRAHARERGMVGKRWRPQTEPRSNHEALITRCQMQAKMHKFVSPFAYSARVLRFLLFLGLYFFSVCMS